MVAPNPITPSPITNQISLQDAIEALRQEISKAILKGTDKTVQFEVGEIEMEFQVAIEDNTEQTDEDQFSFKFFVLKSTEKISEKNSTVHKLKIPLKPVYKDGKPVYTASKRELG